jgi:hypothetical protein
VFSPNAAKIHDLTAGIDSYFRNHITEQDTLEAYEIGAEIDALSMSSSSSTTRQTLTLHLRSLNLSEVDQIPNEPGADWADNFMASLRGLIRKNYPTVSLQ